MYAGMGNPHRTPASTEIATRWKWMPRLEYDFYHFVKKRFYDQMESLGLDT